MFIVSRSRGIITLTLQQQWYKHARDRKYNVCQVGFDVRSQSEMSNVLKKKNIGLIIVFWTPSFLDSPYASCNGSYALYKSFQFGHWTKWCEESAYVFLKFRISRTLAEILLIHSECISAHYHWKKNYHFFSYFSANYS